MTGSLSRQAAHGTAWLGLVNLLSKGSQVLVTLALGVFLTRSDVGAVTMVVVLVNLGQTLQSMGVYDLVSRTRHEPLAFAGSVATLSVAVGLVAGVALLVGGGLVAEVLGAPNAAWPLRIAALGLPFTAYAGVQLGYLHRFLDFRRRLIPDAGSALAGAAVTIGCAAAGAGRWSLVAGLLVTAILAPVLGLAVGVRIPLRWKPLHVRESLAWIRVVGPAAVLGILLLNLDYVVVTRTLGEEANGLYSYAYRFAFVPYIMIAVVIGGVAFPVYTRLVEREGPAGLGPAFTSFAHVLLATTGGLYLLLGLLAPRIVVIDERWAPSADVLRVLCLYGLLLGLIQAGYDVLRAAGRPGLFLRAQALHVLLLLVLALALVRPAGIVGVAWAQVLAAGVVWLIVGVLLYRCGIGQPGLARAAAGPLIAALATVGVHLVLVAAGLLAAPSSMIGLVVEGAILTATYAGTLWTVDRAAVRELRGLVG